MDIITWSKIGMVVGVLGMALVLVKNLSLSFPSKFKGLRFLLFLEKLLSRVKIFILKLENQIDHIIRFLKRERKKQILDKNYWEKLKRE